MGVIYSFHARLRMKQRGITSAEVESVLDFPAYKKEYGSRREVVGIIKGRLVRVKFVYEERNIR